MTSMQRLTGTLTAVLVLCNLLYAKDYYVSPSGDDHNPGSLEKPFATIKGARDAIRALPSPERANDIHVYFRGGTYQLKETVVFGLEDGAPDGSKIIYQAYGGERPVFSSGVSVKGWTRLKTSPPTLPEAARGNVQVADIPDGIGRFFTMYDGDHLNIDHRPYVHLYE